MFPYRRSTLIQNTVVTAMASNRYLLLFEDKINITIDIWKWWMHGFGSSRRTTRRYEWITSRWTGKHENRNSESYYHKNALNSWSLFFFSSFICTACSSLLIAVISWWWAFTTGTWKHPPFSIKWNFFYRPGDFFL